jgi:hypothetical protein
MDSAFNLVYAMRGVSSLKTYEQFIDLKWWGYSTPKEFPGTAPHSPPDDARLSADQLMMMVCCCWGWAGFNDPNSPWPYWSSPAMTHAMSLIALANFQALQQCP